MYRRDRGVHFVSLLAILVSMFSPVLNQPVLAQEPPEQATPVVETPVVLTPVTPVMPGISDATCDDGVVFAQIAVPAETEGVSYIIGEPDAVGSFTVTASLTDITVYTWADTGLDGWTVDGEVATAIGTVAPCPVPDPDSALVESGSATGESDQPSSVSSEVSTPEVGTMDARIGPLESPRYTTSLTTALSGPIQPGATIEYTLSVKITPGNVGRYDLVGTLPEGVTYSGVEFPSEIEGNHYCNVTGRQVECGQGEGVVIALFPDEWTFSVKVNDDYVSASTCENGLTASFEVQSIIWGNSSPTPSVLSLPNSLCPQTLKMEHSVQDLLTQAPATRIRTGMIYEYRYDISNTGLMRVDGFVFNANLPAGVTLQWDESVLPEGCTVSSPVDAQVTCTTGLSPGESARIRISGLVTSNLSQLASGVCTDGMVSSATVTGSYWSGDHVLSDTVPLEEDACVPSLSMTFSADNPTIALHDDQVSFTITISNSGIVDATDVDVIGTLPANLHIGEWSVTQSGTVGTCVVETNNIDCDGLTVPAQVGSDPGVLTVTYSLPEGTTYPTAACTSHTSTATLRHASLSDAITSEASAAIDCAPLLTYSIEADTTAASNGEEVTFTITVTNIGSADSGQYQFLSQLSGSEWSLVHKDPWEVTAPNGILCERNAAGTALNCYNNQELPIPPGGTHEYTATTVVDSPETCFLIVSFGGGETGPWADGSRYFERPIPHHATLLNCNTDLIMEVSTDIAAGESATAGQEVEYTVEITNIGEDAVDAYEFQTDFPHEELLNYAAYSVDPLRTCSAVAGVPMKCGLQTGTSLAPGTTDTYVFKGEVSAASCADGVVVQTTPLGTTWGENSQPIETYIPVECSESLGLAVTDHMTDEESIGLNEEFTYTITVTNTGTAVSGDFSFRSVLPAGVIPSGDLDSRCTSATNGGLFTITCSDSGVPIGADNGVDFEINAVAVGDDGPTACEAEFVQFQVFGDGGTWDETQNYVVERTYIECVSSFTFTIEPLDAMVVPGETIGFKHTIHNTGNTRITSLGIEMDDFQELPGDAEWNRELKINGEPIESGALQLEPGDILTITVESSLIPIDLTLPDDDWCIPWQSTAAVTASFSWGEDQEISRSASVQVNCTDFSVDMEVNAPVIAPGGQVEYTITVTNNSSHTFISLAAFAEVSDASSVFTNWTPASEDAERCGFINAENLPHYGCNFLEMMPDQTYVVTITGDAPDIPTLEQCEPVASSFMFAYWQDRTQQVITGEPVTTQIDCQPGVEISKSGDVDTGEDGRVDVGDVVTYTLEVTNTGNLNIYDIVVTDEMAGVVWDPDLEVDMLAPGEVATFTGAYVVTQEDIDAGTLTGSTTVDASLIPPGDGAPEPDAARISVFGFAQNTDDTPTQTDSVTHSITTSLQLMQEPGVTLEGVSAADTGDDDELNLGETISYTFTVTNTGNVTLNDLEVIDALEGVTFDGDTSIASLAPGESVGLTARYIVTEADVDVGVVENCADVTGVAPNESMVSDLHNCVSDPVAQIPMPPGTPEPTATPDVPATPEVPVTPEPSATSDIPATTEPSSTPAVPATPESTATPDVPATPESSATSIATEGSDSENVTGLPETGHGAGVLTPVFWIAATLGIVVLGLGGLGIRRSRG